MRLDMAAADQMTNRKTANAATKTLIIMVVLQVATIGDIHHVRRWHFAEVHRALFDELPVDFGNTAAALFGALLALLCLPAQAAFDAQVFFGLDEATDKEQGVEAGNNGDDPTYLATSPCM